MIRIYQNTEFPSQRFLRKLKRYLSSILSEHGYRGYEMNLLLTDNEGIRSYNEDYRHKEGATDVLSFSQLEGEENADDEKLLGDVILSVEKATSQATEYGVTLFEEAARLSIHGTLHLLGFDHENVPEETAEEMYSLQNHLTDEFIKKHSFR